MGIDLNGRSRSFSGERTVGSVTNRFTLATASPVVKNGSLGRKGMPRPTAMSGRCPTQSTTHCGHKKASNLARLSAPAVTGTQVILFGPCFVLEDGAALVSVAMPPGGSL